VIPAGVAEHQHRALEQVKKQERGKEKRTCRLHVHGQEPDDLLASLRRLVALAPKLLLDLDLEVAVVLLGEDLEVLEERCGHVGLFAELVDHGRDRVAPLLRRELEGEVGEGDADLGEDDARAGRELSQGGEERVAEGEEVLVRELVEVVGDLRARARGGVSQLARSTEAGTKGRAHLGSERLRRKEFGLDGCVGREEDELRRRPRLVLRAGEGQRVSLELHRGTATCARPRLASRGPVQLHPGAAKRGRQRQHELLRLPAHRSPQSTPSSLAATLYPQTRSPELVRRRKGQIEMKWDARSSESHPAMRWPFPLRLGPGWSRGR